MSGPLAVRRGEVSGGEELAPEVVGPAGSMAIVDLVFYPSTPEYVLDVLVSAPGAGSLVHLVLGPSEEGDGWAIYDLTGDAADELTELPVLGEQVRLAVMLESSGWIALLQGVGDETVELTGVLAEDYGETVKVTVYESFGGEEPWTPWTLRVASFAAVGAWFDAVHDYDPGHWLGLLNPTAIPAGEAGGPPAAGAWTRTDLVEWVPW